jgi:hypothetical protein
MKFVRKLLSPTTAIRTGVGTACPKSEAAEPRKRNAASVMRIHTPHNEPDRRERGWGASCANRATGFAYQMIVMSREVVG